MLIVVTILLAASSSKVGLDDQVSQSAKILSTVWGSSANDLWALGVVDLGYTPVALHWDGHSWTASTMGSAGTWTGMSGSGPNDVWAVGSSTSGAARIAHWDGTSWRLEDRPEMGQTGAAIWVASPGDAWAFGDSGTLFRKSH